MRALLFIFISLNFMEEPLFANICKNGAKEKHREDFQNYLMNHCFIVE